MNPPVQGLTERQYGDLCALIQAASGIVFAPGKRVMVEGRLRRRARQLGIDSLAGYCEYLNSAEGRVHEHEHLIDAVTTHKTDFYREPAHFQYLATQALAELVERGAGTSRVLEVWSSACSTGEEPYTLAMVLADFAERKGLERFRSLVTGTDISVPVLETARMAVYSEVATEPLPDAYRRYLMRSRDRALGTVRISPEIRSAVRFRHLNLLETQYGFREPFDVVFCRNVMIYFDRATQAQVLGRIARSLRVGGYLFMGHSESLWGLDLPLRQTASTVYRRISD